VNFSGPSDAFGRVSACVGKVLNGMGVTVPVRASGRCSTAAIGVWFGTVSDANAWSQIVGECRLELVASQIDAKIVEQETK
jgi:hypothetical protein